MTAAVDVRYSPVSQEPVNNRLATMFKSKAGVDKTLKLTGALLGGAKYACGFSDKTSGFGERLGAIKDVVGMVRGAVKIADALENIGNPDKRVSEPQYVMGIMKQVSFGVGDAFTAVNFLNDQGVYTLPEGVREGLGTTSAALGLLGCSTAVVSSAYGIHENKSKIAILEKEIATLTEQGRLSDDSLELKDKFQVATDRFKVDQLKEKNLKNTLSIVEKIIDVAAIVFGFLSCFVAPVVFIPIMAGLALISSSIALYKLWRESAGEPKAPELFLTGQADVAREEETGNEAHRLLNLNYAGADTDASAFAGQQSQMLVDVAE